MRLALSVVLGLSLVGCSSYEPTAVKVGDVCYRCGRVVTDAKLGAQLLRTNGQLSTFRTPACLAKYLEGNQQVAVKTIYVTDYESGEMFPVTSAKFVKVTIDPATRERDFYAFKSTSAAAKLAADQFSAVVDWTAIRTLAAAAERKGE
jgi:hypothetical protein